MNASSTSICFNMKYHEDWVWKLNWKIEFFVPSTGHQNCLDKCLHYHYHCDCENQCHLQVKLFFIWYFFLLFYPRNILVKPWPFCAKQPVFSTLIQIFNILLVWGSVLSLVKRILLFFIHNRSNCLISVRIVLEHH